MVANGATVIEAVCAPVDQVSVPEQPPTVSVADWPEHIVGEFSVSTGDGFTVIVALATSEQPSALLTVTE